MGEEDSGQSPPIYPAIGNLLNLDFGKDYSQIAFQNYKNGHPLLGTVNLLDSASELVLDFAAAMIGSACLAAGIAATNTLITTESVTSAYVSWQVNLNSNIETVSSKMHGTINALSVNTGIKDLSIKIKEFAFNLKYYHLDGNPRFPRNNGFIGIPTELELKPGTIVDRFGYDSGSFVSPLGTTYSQRSLPPGTQLKPYSVFEVIKPINVKSGEIKPWFGEEGHGTQYMFNQSISELLENGTLRRLEY